MPYKPKDIADYFLLKGADDANMTPMKLIKLVYIAHGWSLGIYNKTLINEKPQAWKFGPVIPSLYDEFKEFGNKKIEKVVQKPNLEKELEDFLDKIWNVYGKYTGVQLSAKTHEPNTPWSKTWEKAKEYFNTFSLQIPDSLIREHYLSKIHNTNS
ncbi:type II toxin-antitoxin system antitoxin SocA domain-containing protein [Flavobacterium oreochromis]|uniref:Type II toxin-antitoxin system antitoxin SocA domain-containing protein n=1 Tax=Flavobacterium oreochromis TaxID=2906078 RepID=A0ABW8PC30_9FLAO|nr:type II toxin-antitoxin system antitoxin SocA domain-containing protein [Flavobacterium oreochromis]OWP74709.1 hypothetical protein BWG23_13230 [Flavobacterium oreochromis]